MTPSRKDKPGTRAAIAGWLPAIGTLLMGATISQDIEAHVVAGTVLLVAAGLALFLSYLLDPPRRP